VTARRTRVVDGTEVLVEGAGATTVVMVHGWPDTRALWDGTVARLAPRYRCVRFTLPGYAPDGDGCAPGLDAMVAHFAAIVDAASPAAPVVLLLHDWGAIYGYQYAARHPERVARIVGVDVGDATSPELRRALDAKAKAMIAGYQLFLAGAWRLPRALGDRMTRAMARALRAPAPPQAIGARMNYPYAHAWSGGFRGARRFEPHCPMLFVYGERKPFMFHSPQWAGRLAARPGGAVQGLPGGHWVMCGRTADAFEARVLAWLDDDGTAPRGG
jgi:pimeloyl-ACP methyl ester carboxylesterase